MSTAVVEERDVVRPGVMLPNGALVMAVMHDRGMTRFNDDREQGYVLGVTTWKQSSEYVTWSFVVDERGVVTVSGHYFMDVVDAVNDLAKRSK